MSFDWMYYAISWVLLRWHDLWSAIVPEEPVLGTSWQWVLSIIFLVITLRVVLFPLFVKQIKSQRAMQALQPKVKELQAKYKNDRETLQRELVELYRREKANPLMGCLPLLIQAPVFFALFHVLRRLDPDKGERAQTLYGWTADQFLSASNSLLFNAPLSRGFGATSADLAGFNVSTTTVRIVAGVLIIAMAVTTHLTARQMVRRTGWAEDPTQLLLQRLMVYGFPAGLLISGAFFPIGVVLYWVINNLFSLGQQQWVLRAYPPPNAKPNAKGQVTKEAPKVAPPRPGAKPVKNKKKGAQVTQPVAKSGTAVAEQNGKGDKAPAATSTASTAPRPGVKPANSRKSRSKRKASR